MILMLLLAGNTWLLLAHLSQRLTRWAYSIPMVRSPSVVVHHPHFQTWISLKPVGQSWSNFFLLYYLCLQNSVKVTRYMLLQNPQLAYAVLHENRGSMKNHDMLNNTNTPQPLYNAIFLVQSNFHVNTPNHVVSRGNCIDYIGKGVLNSYFRFNTDPCYIQNRVTWTVFP